MLKLRKADFILHLVRMLPLDLIYRLKAEKLILFNLSPLLIGLALISTKEILGLEAKILIAILLVLTWLPHIFWYSITLSALRQLRSRKRAKIWIKVIFGMELLLLFGLLLIKPEQFLGWLTLIQHWHLLLVWISSREIFKILPQQNIFMKLLMLLLWYNPVLGPWTLRKVLAPISNSD